MFSKQTTKCIVVLVMAMFGFGVRYAYCDEGKPTTTTPVVVAPVPAPAVPAISVVTPAVKPVTPPIVVPTTQEIVAKAIMTAVQNGDSKAAADWAACQRDLVIVEVYGPVADLIKVNKPMLQAAIACTPALLQECGKKAATDSANQRDPVQKQLALLWSDVLLSKEKPADVPVWFEKLAKADAEKAAERAKTIRERIEEKLPISAK